MMIGYQGEPGAYSEVAALQFFGPEQTFIGYDNFTEVLNHLKRDLVDYILLPVENSTTGLIFLTMDLLRQEQDLFALGETYVPIDHHLMTKEASTLEEIHWAYSHPEALKQCEFFLQEHGIRPQIYEDTASSAKYIAQYGKAGEACIASRRAGEIYGLQILQSHIQDISHNTTRFLVIGKDGEKTLGNKSTVYFETFHKPGALADILQLFKENNINLLTLNSRPAIHQSLFEYGFFMEFNKSIQEEGVRQVLEKLQNSCHYYNFIGSYYSADF